MKKTYHIIFVCFTVLMLFAGAAMAGTLSSTDRILEAATADSAYPDLENINVSPNVEMGYNTTANSFALSSFNTKGTIVYGVASDSANIFFQDAGTNTTVPAPTGTDSTYFGSSWAKLGGGS